MNQDFFEKKWLKLFVTYLDVLVLISFSSLFFVCVTYVSYIIIYSPFSLENCSDPKFGCNETFEKDILLVVLSMATVSGLAAILNFLSLFKKWTHIIKLYRITLAALILFFSLSLVFGF